MNSVKRVTFGPHLATSEGAPCGAAECSHNSSTVEGSFHLEILSQVFSRTVKSYSLVNKLTEIASAA